MARRSSGPPLSAVALTQDLGDALPSAGLSAAPISDTSTAIPPSPSSPTSPSSLLPLSLILRSLQTQPGKNLPESFGSMAMGFSSYRCHLLLCVAVLLCIHRPKQRLRKRRSGEGGRAGPDCLPAAVMGFDWTTTSAHSVSTFTSAMPISLNAVLTVGMM